LGKQDQDRCQRQLFKCTKAPFKLLNVDDGDDGDDGLGVAADDDHFGNVDDVDNKHANASDGGHQKVREQLRHQAELLTRSAELMRAPNENPCMGDGACTASNCNAVYNQTKVCPVGWRLLDPHDIEKEGCADTCPVTWPNVHWNAL